MKQVKIPCTVNPLNYIASLGKDARSLVFFIDQDCVKDLHRTANQVFVYESERRYVWYSDILYGGAYALIQPLSGGSWSLVTQISCDSFTYQTPLDDTNPTNEVYYVSFEHVEPCLHKT